MLSDIFQAYFDCRRRKRRTPEALLWEQNFEKNCLQLCQEITAGSYQPDDYKLIYVTDPVMREIFVPTFRDRVVHHLLANWLRPQLEKIFIYDNYAGREGRGTLFGIRRAEKFMRQVTRNYQQPAYVLKLDIAAYFRSIPKERLWEKLESVIPAKGACEREVESRGIATRSEQYPLGTFDSKSTQNCRKQINSLFTSATDILNSGRSDSICSRTLVSENSGEINNSEEREREYLGTFSKQCFPMTQGHILLA